jgi:hypothetical protein
MSINLMRVLKISAIIAGAVLVTAVLLTSNMSNSNVKGQGVEPIVQYSAKFVCGEIPQGPILDPAGNPIPIFEPPVKPGNYATAINIHNSLEDRDVAFVKKFVIAPPEPQSGGPLNFHTQTLAPDHATEVDCDEISKQVTPAGANPAPFIKGFVVINVPSPVGLDPDPLDVVAVYTSLKEVAKNKIFFEVKVDCERNDTSAVSACQELKKDLSGKKLEIVTEVHQDRILDPEALVKKVLNIPAALQNNVKIKLIDVDLGVGVGESIDVEEVHPKAMGLPSD